MRGGANANYGTDITYEGVLDMVDQEVPGPTRLIQDAGRIAGRALADLCAFLNPDVLILDAGNPTASNVLIGGVREQFESSASRIVRRWR